MKKTRTALLVLTLLISCLYTSCALAVQPITITSVNNNADGSVTIGWDNPNSGTVTVGSLVMSDDAAANQIIVESEVYGSSYTFCELAPGVEYALLVMPELDINNAGIEFVTAPEMPAFDDFRLSVTDVNLTYFVPKGSSYTYNYATDLSPDEIYDLLDEKQFWVRINFRHADFNNSFTVPVLTVVTSPTGNVTTQYDDLEITKDTIGFWRTMVYMNNSFENMHENGGIPSGKYSVKVYVDGGYVGESSFTIK